MNDEILGIKEKIKQKRNNATSIIKIKKESKGLLYKYLNRLLIITVLTLITLIFLKSNTNFRNFFYKNIYDTNFSFAKVNDIYEKYFGSPIPFKDLFKDKTTPVFNEKLKYKESNKYKDGVKLVVDTNYLVPSIDKGIVIFIGDKDEYKNTIIIQQSDGVDVWYSNVGNINVKLYDYVKEGSLLGETIDNNLYLVFKKDGTILDYKDFI
ncbi:MAG: M23 family metallopeptidase [Bacilli bacterium]|nr:M23 family metallopeptidase [Bacilli bacterium]MDD4282392.1 M23 family metallopeptidase [Bacilli bacterium]MDD4718983.1 M23 family metallopeptidase [Bacilli bacterium]